LKLLLKSRRSCLIWQKVSHEENKFCNFNTRKEKRKESRKAVKLLKQKHYLAKFGKTGQQVLLEPKPEPLKKSVKFNEEEKQKDIEEKKKKKESKFKKAQVEIS
jgi:hypothetical protein